MGADLSRITFDQRKQYAAVVLQQGRLLLDADFNEQAAIGRHRDETVAGDVIGRTGAPREGGGFELSALGTGLEISAGRMYVDGIPVDNAPQIVSAAPGAANDQLQLESVVLGGARLQPGDVLETNDGSVRFTVARVVGGTVTCATAHGLASRVEVRRVVTLENQPIPGPVGGTLAVGRYVAVLHVRLREVSVVDDPDLAEPALGGPDTSARHEVSWRVALHRVGPVGSGGPGTWVPRRRTGRLLPLISMADFLPDDCTLPADIGLGVTENSLFRVEVDSYDPATKRMGVLWDRDNASTTSLITASSDSLRLATFGPDGERGFGDNQVVTVTDEQMEDAGVRGSVGSTYDARPLERTIRVRPAPTGIDLGARPRIRRWTGYRPDALEGGPIQILPGLSVEITSPTVGDFWLIPIRPSLPTLGGLVWPTDELDIPVAKPVDGPEEHSAVLAVVDWNGTSFSPTDHRPVFPALTAITATDVSYDDTVSSLGADTVQEALDLLSGRIAGGCTITVAAGSNWAGPLSAIPPGGDAKICFRAGVFDSQSRVTLSGTGHLVLEGIGPASLVRATKDDVALELAGWASVTIRDLAFTTVPATVGTGGLGGALTIRGCHNVTVENVTAACRSAPTPESSCITIAGPDLVRAGGSGTGMTLPTRAIVRDCTLGAGEYQVGLEVRGFSEIVVSGVNVVAPETTSWQTLATLPKPLRVKLVRQLAHGFTDPGTPPASVAPPRPGFRGTSTRRIDTGPLTFRTPGPFAQAWRDVLGALPAPATASQARTLINKVAAQAVRANPADASRPLRALIEAHLAQRAPVISQGIVVGGRVIGRVRVENCTVNAAIQGIHVGTSEGGPTPMERRANAVVIRGNVVRTIVPPESAGVRHGIFVGNADFVLVTDNNIALLTQAINDRIPSEGIRVWGTQSADVVIRDNVLFYFPIAIRMSLREGIPPLRWWIRGNAVSPGGWERIRVEGAYPSKVDRRGNPGVPDNPVVP